MCFDTILIAHESGHVSVLLAKVILTAYDNVYSLYSRILPQQFFLKRVTEKEQFFKKTIYISLNMISSN